MRTQLKINGEWKDVEIENGEITIIEPEKKATGWDFSTRPYYITAAGVTGGKELNCDGMAKIYETADAFSSKELAENISRMQTIQRQLFRWQAENDEPPILVKKGNKDPQRWRIEYNYCSKEFQPGCYYKKGDIIFPDFSPVFSSSQKVIECIRAFKDELIWLFTEFRWRMDD